MSIAFLIRFSGHYSDYKISYFYTQLILLFSRQYGQRKLQLILITSTFNFSYTTLTNRRIIYLLI